MPRGGRRKGAGGRSKWKHGKTKTIRVPEVLADKILDYAHKLDIGATIEHETESKIVDLTGIVVRVVRSNSAVYIADLMRAGFEIKPESLAVSVKRRSKLDNYVDLKSEIENIKQNL